MIAARSSNASRSISFMCFFAGTLGTTGTARVCNGLTCPHAGVTGWGHGGQSQRHCFRFGHGGAACPQCPPCFKGVGDACTPCRYWLSPVSHLSPVFLHGVG
jgi:hypothetical protein